MDETINRESGNFLEYNVKLEWKEYKNYIIKLWIKVYIIFLT